MKKIIVALMMGMMALGAMAQDGKFTVTSSLEGLGDSAMYMLIDAKTQRTIAVEMMRVVDGKVDLTIDLDKAATFILGSVTGGKPDFNVWESFPALPGENLTISGNSDNMSIGGSEFYQDYSGAMKMVSAKKRAITWFLGGLQAQMAMGVPQDSLKQKYEEKYPALQKALNDAVMNYVEANRDKAVSAALLAEFEDNIELIEAGAALLSKDVQESPAADLYKGILESARYEREVEERQEGLAGNPAPDFTLNDINGNPLALSSLRGKWVIIDFWGSWCGWCIKGMPKMKEYYEKYGDKLEILGVDCNDTVEKWKGAVAKHELPWLHVYCDMENGDRDVLKMYGVSGFPTKVVVDPEGRVAKVIVGEDPAFYDYLDEVLN